MYRHFTLKTWMSAHCLLLCKSGRLSAIQVVAFLHDNTSCTPTCYRPLMHLFSLRPGYTGLLFSSQGDRLRLEASWARRFNPCGLTSKQRRRDSKRNRTELQQLRRVISSHTGRWSWFIRVPGSVRGSNGCAQQVIASRTGVKKARYYRIRSGHVNSAVSPLTRTYEPPASHAYSVTHVARWVRRIASGCNPASSL